MSAFAGSWIRYKVENEKEQMTYVGWGEMYEQMKAHTPTMVITDKNADSHVEVYSRGEWNQEFLVNVGGESEFDMGDGTKAKIYPVYENSEKTIVRFEFDHKGIHHKYIRTATKDEIVDVTDFDNGKCTAKHYYKRV